MALHQQLALQCIRDNSSSTAYGPRKWTCTNCGQGFSRGSGSWVKGVTRQECDRELLELGQLAGIRLLPLAWQSLAEVQSTIASLREILKNANWASYYFCCGNCYLTHNLRLI